MRSVARICWTVVLLLMAPIPGVAEEVRPAPERKKLEAETSRDYLRFAFNFYDQADHGGDPNLDEDVIVLEPQILLGVGLTEDLSVTLKGQADIISAASVDRGHRYAPGALSGASGDEYFGIEAAAFYAWSDQLKTGAGASASMEYDYKSIGANARVVWDTPDRNDTLVAKVSVYFDTMDVLLFDGTDLGDEERTSWSLGLGWTHVLGRRTVMTLNYDFTVQDGFLSTPYNSVHIAGTEVQEILPDSRLRHAVFGRLRHLWFDDLAVEPGLGLYIDDWGAEAATLELRAFWECVPGILILQPWYRFHAQSEVDQFVSESDASIPRERTQDSDLASFTSHTLGVKLVAPHVNLLGVDTELEIGGDGTWRSHGLHSWSVTAGFMIRF